MTFLLHSGTTAKLFHWMIVALLVVQYLIGWLMPDIHRGMKPGAAMTFHVSFGLLVLILIVLRFAWRLIHPVAPGSSLSPWQRLSSEAVHWLLYALVLATTVTGWLFASFRGWSMSFFLSGADADAGCGQCSSGKDDQRPASGDGVGAAGDDRHSHRGSAGSHFHLPRPHHAADAAGIAVLRQQ